MVNVKSVTDRRTLHFKGLDDILADIEQPDRAGRVRSTGNWTPGQIVEHVARFIEYSLDGFPFTAPWPLRVIGVMIRGAVLRNPMKAGVKPPKDMRAHEPDESVTWDEAVQHLRSLVERVRGGELMRQPSPVFGSLSHEQWAMLHCRHAEMHFSFLHSAGT